MTEYDRELIVLYQELEIQPGASPEDIKRAYRRLALRHHPDKNPAGADKFKCISHAYEILSDPQRRELYLVQKRQEQTSRERSSPPAQQQWPPRRGARRAQDYYPAPFTPFVFRDPMDIWNEMFGGAGPFDNLFGMWIFARTMFICYNTKSVTFLVAPMAGFPGEPTPNTHYHPSASPFSMFDNDPFFSNSHIDRQFGSMHALHHDMLAGPAIAARQQRLAAGGPHGMRSRFTTTSQVMDGNGTTRSIRMTFTNGPEGAQTIKSTTFNDGTTVTEHLSSNPSTGPQRHVPSRYYQTRRH